MSKIDSYKTQFEKRLFFRFLLEYNKAGVYALINEKHKKIFIQSSSNIINHVGNQVNLLSKRHHFNKLLIKDRKYLNIKLLEYCENRFKDIMKLKWIEHYKSLGYTIYNTEKIPVYRVRKAVVMLERGLMDMQVQLVSLGKRVSPVASFKTEIEADEFIKNNTVYDMLILTKISK